MRLTIDGRFTRSVAAQPAPILAWALVLAACIAGCGPAEPPANGTSPTPEAKSATSIAPLRIAAASDLQNVMPVLAERFQAEHGRAVEFTLGSSGQLAQQIRQGAPFDVFLAANRAFVDDLAAQGAVRPDSV